MKNISFFLAVALVAVIIATRSDIYQDFQQGNLFEKPTRPVVILRNNDYKTILERFIDNPNAFIYLDPPYPVDTRRSQKRLYSHDWDIDDHYSFLSEMSEISTPTMISSYPNPLYDHYLNEWHKYYFTSIIRGGRKAQEVIYMNYPPLA